MSERGLLLALQRLHDDPGFVDLVAADPQSSLGIYDLDEEECQSLIQAANSKDEATLKNMATKVGIDWGSNRISGAGALENADEGVDRASRTGLTGQTTTSGPTRTAYNSENTSPYGAASPRDYDQNGRP
jgi:hypothetical protein